MTDAELDKPLSLDICGWQNNPHHCVYLNEHRIVGGKPWGGGTTTKHWDLTLRELACAIPELQKILRLDYLGNPIKEDAND